MRTKSTARAADVSDGVRGELFDADYYRKGCGPSPYERSEGWLRLFNGIAGDLVRIFRPRTVLDAGCALGMLVESLWDRGVDARGIDVSAFAIANARPDIQPYLRVGSLVEDLGGPYDLVTCIEVLEHIPPDEAARALDRLCAAGDTILFSSSPSDFDEPTHVNVRPPIAWLRDFASRGFLPDPMIDASFVAPQAFVVRRADGPPDELVLRLVAERIRLACQVAALEPQVADRQRLAHECDDLRLHHEAATSERDQLREHVGTLVERLTAADGDRERQSNELRTIRLHLEAALAEREQQRAELEAIRLHLEAALSERAGLRRDIDALHAQAELGEEERRRAQVHFDAALAERDALRAETEALSAELDRARDERAGLAAEIAVLGEQVKSSEAALARLRTDLAASLVEQDELRANTTALIARQNAAAEETRLLRESFSRLADEHQTLRDRTAVVLAEATEDTDRAIDAVEKAISATQTSLFWRLKLRFRRS